MISVTIAKDLLYGMCYKLEGGTASQMKGCYLILTQIMPQNAGGRLNKKDGLTRYGDSHVKDKTS